VLEYELWTFDFGVMFWEEVVLIEDFRLLAYLSDGWGLAKK
jgi:hypothetical protein